MKEDGYFIETSPSGKVLSEGATKRCVHCGGHFIIHPGSGRQRGYCSRCNGILCGASGCMSRCQPFEQWLEQVERGVERQNGRASSGVVLR